MEIVPLNVISTYSLLQSPLRPTELVQGAKSRGYRAVALADWNVMYGAIDFYNAAKAAGIKPLLGLRLDFKADTSTGTFFDAAGDRAVFNGPGSDFACSAADA